MHADIAMMSATALLDAYAAKTVSPVEATQAALKQIETHNDHFNSFCLVDAHRWVCSMAYRLLSKI
jgi:aspartyl-tRNA(Asn)/glutamyl-tRNA(Gln) amidotransferase subunit A